ncbi:hypothetical protein AB0K66_31305 [Streptomyces werraensis]|uniref:hypothetical protein n=1 Tax=Streptomyces werraensis TaxID=68284 RepID=UPI003418F379
MTYSRARRTFARRRENSRRSRATACGAGVTVPHGPAPHGAASRAAAHPESSKPAPRHSPAGSRSVTLQAASVTIRRSPRAVRTTRTASRPAGPSVPLTASTAITLLPDVTCSRTSTTAGRRQSWLSVARSVRATSRPLTDTE